MPIITAAVAIVKTGVGVLATSWKDIGGAAIAFHAIKSYIFGKNLRTIEYPNGELNTVTIRFISVKSLKKAILRTNNIPSQTLDDLRLCRWVAPHFTERVATNAELKQVSDDGWIIWTRTPLAQVPTRFSIDKGFPMVDPVIDGIITLLSELHSAPFVAPPPSLALIKKKPTTATIEQTTTTVSTTAAATPATPVDVAATAAPVSTPVASVEAATVAAAATTTATTVATTAATTTTTTTQIEVEQEVVPEAVPAAQPFKPLTENEYEQLVILATSKDEGLLTLYKKFGMSEPEKFKRLAVLYLHKKREELHAKGKKALKKKAGKKNKNDEDDSIEEEEEEALYNRTKSQEGTDSVTAAAASS